MNTTLHEMKIITETLREDLIRFQSRSDKLQQWEVTVIEDLVKLLGDKVAELRKT